MATIIEALRQVTLPTVEDGGATVHRNMPEPDRVYRRGEVPNHTVGMWFTHCTEHGHFRTGPGAWFANPTDAQRAADYHNRNHHAVCGATEHDEVLWYCTRKMGHDGPHTATYDADGETVIGLAWED